MHADEHAGAMNVYMTMMRTGLFLQREGSGSEPDNLPVVSRRPTYRMLLRDLNVGGLRVASVSSELSA